MKILNLYAGIGGNRKLWGNDLEITAVEWDASIAEIYKDLYPNDNVIVGDAHQYLLDHYSEYDFIWASPPFAIHSTNLFFYFQKWYSKVSQEIMSHAFLLFYTRFVITF